MARIDPHKNLRSLRLVPIVLLSLALTLATGCSGDKTKEAGEKNGSTANERASKGQKFEGDRDSKFCVELREIDNSQRAATESDVQQTYETMLANATKALDSAPADIKPDVEVFVNRLSKLVEAMKAKDWNVKDVDPAVLKDMQDKSVVAASTRIGEYQAQVCGIKNSNSPDATESPDPTDGSSQPDQAD